MSGFAHPRVRDILRAGLDFRHGGVRPDQRCSACHAAGCPAPYSHVCWFYDNLVTSRERAGRCTTRTAATVLWAASVCAGLWITYQSCNHVTLNRGIDAFTLRLTAGNPHFPA